MAGEPSCSVLCAYQVGSADLWDLTVSHSGCTRPGASSGFRIFECFSLFVGTNLNTNFKNSYLELGMSNLSEPKFVRFILMYTI
jgi:hypothetical protein